MSETEEVVETKTKWHSQRRCACGDCRFFSWEERPKCPAMKADPSLVGERLWYMDVDMIGLKDYVDPMDTPKQETKRAVREEPEKPRHRVSEVGRLTVEPEEDESS